MTTTKVTFRIPEREEVSTNNQAIFNTLEKHIGFLPNVYAYFAKNDTALADYLALQNRKTTLTAKEKEVVNLVTSQLNQCKYCQSAHTVIGQLHGFSKEQILAIRKGTIDFNDKLDALAKFTTAVVNNRGKASQEAIHTFFEAGYDEANMIDVVMMIGDKIISNYIHNLANFEIDFPLAEEL